MRAPLISGRTTGELGFSAVPSLAGRPWGAASANAGAQPGPPVPSSSRLTPSSDSGCAEQRYRLLPFRGRIVTTGLSRGGQQRPSVLRVPEHRKPCSAFVSTHPGTSPLPPTQSLHAMTTRNLVWRDQSVVRFAERDDPVRKMEDLSRASVLAAVEEGWTGPPFDPIELATLRQIRVRPNAAIPDARVSLVEDYFEIQYNPNRPRARVNFSIAHEIAHTFFPDCADAVRNRSSSSWHEHSWELEMLCNIGAAELLMPFHSFALDVPVSIEQLMRLRRTFQVSAEAVLLRFVKLASSPLACFSASRHHPADTGYRIDYCIASSNWDAASSLRGLRIPKSKVLHECVAIGTTAKGVEEWIPDADALFVEAVALPPYPSCRSLRLAGFLRPVSKEPTLSGILYRHGDATRFVADGKTAIVHVVNDTARRWGGRGFAHALRDRHPRAHSDYEVWTSEAPWEHQLGSYRLACLDDDHFVLSLVAQSGYGRSRRPRLRYSALDASLRASAEGLRKVGVTSVQMPRIGTGQAGGNWSVVEGLIHEHLVSRGFEVRVFDLP